MSFFEELKRRNVFRVGIAYLVVAWLVMQVLDVVLDSFETPGWVMRTVLVILAAGFPFALIFAWAFEITPEGIKKERDVDRSQSITHVTGRKLDFTIIGVLVVALAYFAYDKFVLTPAAHAPPPQETAQTDPAAKKEKSIAVLPFINMSDDASNEYFSDGISEEILNSLAKVKELKVAGRTSSFSFKGQNQDLRQIGETLGVEHILEGSVRKFGNQIRITAQLIQVEDGFHLWSESYDRELDNVFAIQDEISTAILKELKATLLEGEAEVIAATPTNPEVYDLYLLARQRMYQRTQLTIESAAELLDKAIAMDPEYAPAYAQRGIASILLSVTSYGDLPDDMAHAQAKLYLDKALALDENLAEAWAGLGLYFTRPPPQTDKGIEVLEKALAINPNLIDASNWLAMTYWSVNRAEDAMRLFDAATERDPLYKPAMGNRVLLLSLMGRGPEAHAYLDEMQEFMPGDPNIPSDRAWIESTEGNSAKALELMEAALAVQPNDRVYRVGVNIGNYDTHQYEKVFDDEWSDTIVWALFNLGRLEEGMIVARERAAKGVVRPLFSLLNATGQPEVLAEYLDEHWPDLDLFEQRYPASVFGYREMADIAYAYQHAGNQVRFEDALSRLRRANERSLEQGLKNKDIYILIAAYHAMAGDTDHALSWLAQAVDGGLITSTRISSEYPYFRELEGNPDYEAIQLRMIEHLNDERAQLGLGPVST